MAVTAADGRLLFANPMLAALLGRETDELVDSTLEVITHPDDWSNLGKALYDIVRGTLESYSQRQR